MGCQRIGSNHRINGWQWLGPSTDGHSLHVNGCKCRGGWCYTCAISLKMVSIMVASFNNQQSTINNPPRPTWAEIDLAASAYNIRRIRSLLAPNVKVLAMIKAEAYGHGMVGVARAAERAGASMLGFTSLS